MKKIKKESMYIFFIVLLSVLLVGLFVLTTTGVFYKSREGSSSSFKVGESAVISVEKTEAKVLSFEFDGSFLSGEELKQNISIKNEGEKDLFVRAKITIFTGDNNDPNISLKSGEDWVVADGGEYLYEGFIPSLNTIGFCSGIEIGEETVLKSSNTYILTICVESLSTEFDRMAIWGY